MICSKSAANALGLSKQDNTNGTCAADMYKNYCLVSEQHSQQKNRNNDLFTVNS